MDVLRHLQAHTGVPARPVEDQHDLLARAGPGGAGKRGQLHREERDRDAGREVEEGAPRSRVNEAHQVAPGKTVPHAGDRALSPRGPDAAEHRLQADAVLVGGPPLHACVRKRRGDLP